MPRPNRAREVQYEAHVAERVRVEREARGLTYERLAEKMTDAGCAMVGSAIFKIEKSSPDRPPRRITLNEAVTFSQVLGIPLEDLLLPPAVARHQRAAALFREWESAIDEYLAIAKRVDELGDQIVALVDEDPALADALTSEFGERTPETLSSLRWFRDNPGVRG